MTAVERQQMQHKQIFLRLNRWLSILKNKCFSKNKSCSVSKEQRADLEDNRDISHVSLFLSCASSQIPDMKCDVSMAAPGHA